MSFPNLSLACCLVSSASADLVKMCSTACSSIVQTHLYDSLSLPDLFQVAVGSDVLRSHP